MNLDRVEEVLLGIVAVCMVAYLLPFSLARDIIVTLMIAIALVALLVFRSISWHMENTTPFDGVLIIGICISVLYLISFSAFQHTLLTAIVLLLFAVFYGMMAFLLYQHRWLFKTQTVTHIYHEYRPVQHRPKRKFFLFRDHAHDPEFKKGIEPIPEHEPPHHVHEEKHVAMEPIPEMHGAEVGKVHDKRFKRGLEPIPDVTVAHLHKLGVYDLEKKEKRR